MIAEQAREEKAWQAPKHSAYEMECDMKSMV